MSAKILITGVLVVLLTGCASAGMGGSGTDGDSMSMKAPPGGDYQAAHQLVALPEFIPGLGKLFVQPDTLPAGPFLAYDRRGRLVSTIYMVPLDDLNGQKAFKGLEATGLKTVSTDLYYNAGHPGVEEPHYHIVLWHVPKGEAQLE